MRWRRACVTLLGFAVLLAAAAPAQAPAPPQDQLFGWLTKYDHASAREVSRDPLFTSLIELVVPNLGITMGRDRSLPADLITQFHNSSHKVHVRDGRFVDFSGYRADGGVSQSFLWVDTQQDRALGVVYVQYLGLPNAQRLILFSQREPEHIEIGELPAEFRAALAQWIEAARLPAVLPLFFARSVQQPRPLLHTPGACPAGTAQARCLSMDRSGAELDLESVLQYTRGGGYDAAAEQQQLAAACTAAPANDPDCRTRALHARAATLLAETRLPRPAAPARSDSSVGGGFRDTDAGVAFTIPAGWSSASVNGGVRMVSLDRALVVLVWTEPDLSFAQATSRIAALACRGALVPCFATTNPVSSVLNNAGVETESGEMDAPRMTLQWQADLVAAKLPVLIVYRGSANALAAHATDITAFRSGVQLLP